MSVHLQSLSLTPSWSKEKTVLVRATDAIRLCREGGHEELPSRSALGHLDGLRQQDMVRVRDFVSSARLTGFPLSCFEDGNVLGLLRGAIANRDLVVLREGANPASADGSTTADQRKLIAKIEAKTRAKLNYSGRQYKLVADADLAKIPERDSYEVVRREDAIRVLEGLTWQAVVAPDLVAMLGTAGDKLTSDWRPPLQPEGLILLRRIVSLQAVTDSAEPALTPSQLKQLFQPTGIIEIELIDTEDQPVAGEVWELVLPDGSKRSGQLDDKGYALITAVPEGNCKFTFPRLDGDVWSLCALRS
jgi:hypothetical protein